MSSCWGDNLQAWYDFDNDTLNIAQRTADILAQNTVDYGTWNHVVITRETTIHGNWDEPAITPNFGVDEAAQYIIDEMGGEMIYVYNFGNGSAQDAADLVEYLNCEVGENPNGDNYAKMYAEGAVRTFTKEKVAEFDNWDTTSDKSKASHYSDGTPNQVKYMRYANDVTQHEDKAKMVQPDSVHVYVNDQEWTIGEDLTAAGQENVVQVNCENGEIRFGDGTHGNIPASGSDIRVTYTVEKDGIADYYDAMKAVDPDIKLYSAFSSPNIARVIHDSAEAGADGGKFDGIAVHPYSRTNGQIQDSDPQFYEKMLAAVDSSVITQINSRKSELDKYWPDGSKNVCISAYGIFNHSGDVVQSQTHAVYIAENLMEFVSLGVAYTNKHCLIDFPAGDVLGPGKQALILATKNSDDVYAVNSLTDPDNVKAETFTISNQNDTLEYTMQPHSVVAFQVNIAPDPVDKTQLDQTIAQAEALDLAQYQEEGKDAFQAALAQAKEVAAQEDATQVAVDQAAKALKDAMDALKPLEVVPAPTPTPTPMPTPTPTPGVQPSATPEVKPTQAPETQPTQAPATQTPEGVPPTGDSAQLMWYGAALAAAAFLLSGVAFVRKQRR